MTLSDRIRADLRKLAEEDCSCGTEGTQMNEIPTSMASTFLRRCSRVGEPCPVHTMASSARRATISGWRSANIAARSAPEEIP